jgi:flagellar motor protein MotB
MRFSQRRDVEVPEGESYYISMTDMMVGVVFIFILLLSFFALQYHATTAALTRADDPKTTALLQTASNLEPKTVALQIDYENKVVCIPTAALAKDSTAAASTDRRCFAFSAVPKAGATSAGASSDESRAALTDFLNGDLAAKTKVQADAGSGTLSFNADDLFNPGTDTLSAKGVDTAANVAKALAARLPCYGYTPGATCSGTPKMAAVDVAGNASFNAFSAQGQQDYDLALKRTVAFYKALVADQPVLGQIKDGATDAAQPLLRVASGGQSQAAAAAVSTIAQSISIQFVMAQ